MCGFGKTKDEAEQVFHAFTDFEFAGAATVELECWARR